MLSRKINLTYSITNSEINYFDKNISYNILINIISRQNLFDQNRFSWAMIYH